MIRKLIFFSFFILELQVSSQFNNIYSSNQMAVGTSIAIEENNSTGQYVVPILFFNPELQMNCLGMLNVSSEGLFDSLNILSSYSSFDFYTSGQSFIKTTGGDYFFGGHFDDSLFLQRLDHNLDTIWSNSQFAAPSHFWGGGELSNGDLVFGLAVQNPPSYNTLRINRYSETGEFLNFFNIELDYDFSSPTSFIIDDSLLYVSFSRLLIGSHRRNYIVCYNAITGE
ncbi:MAG: hypothetical protein ACK4WD_05100, partial [Flavobacteriales bacterium]